MMLATYGIILWGSLFGLALGMTGSGGIIAIPVLVYGMGLPTHSAVAVSLFAVAATAFFGNLERFLGHDPNLKWKAGLILAAAGVLLAPVGTKVGTMLPANVLLAIFSALMLFIGVRMWLKATKEPITAPHAETADATNDHDRDHESSGSEMRGLISGGVAAGFLSGFLGVGGGFLIVPALQAAGLSIKQAVSTSLLAVFVISTSGAVSHFIQNPKLDLHIAIEFSIGGVLGLNIGMDLIKSLPAQWIQKIFAIFVILVAIAMLIEKTIA
jgi:uncharacterized membrane protein YfcA